MFEAQLLPSPAPQGHLHVTCRNPSWASGQETAWAGEEAELNTVTLALGTWYMQWVLCRALPQPSSCKFMSLTSFVTYCLFLKRPGAGWGWSSAIEQSASVLKALASVPSIRGKEEKSLYTGVRLRGRKMLDQIACVSALWLLYHRLSDVNKFSHSLQTRSPKSRYSRSIYPPIMSMLLPQLLWGSGAHVFILITHSDVRF